MPLQHPLRREDFPTGSNRTAETAGTGPRTVFHLAGASLAGVTTLMTRELAGGLVADGSVELPLDPQPVAAVASSATLLLVLLEGHGRGENHGAMGAGKPVGPMVLPPAVLLPLSSFDAESVGVVFAVVDQELHPRRDGLADPAVL